MSAPDSPDAVAELLPEPHVEVGVYPSVAEGEEHGLVALALGHAYWLVPAETGFRLVVEAPAAALVRRHLAAYARERLHWPPAPPPDNAAQRPFALLTPLLWSALVLGLHRFAWPPAEIAALDAAAIFSRGEVWRPATSLFVHANAEHVISNALAGLWVFTAVVSTFGRLRGWSLIALAAIAGNLLVAAINLDTPYRSLGASTAIFAGLGLLTGRALAQLLPGRRRRSWATLFAPLASGFTVLALFGAGAAPVDVGAHVAGFLAGFGIGLVATYPYFSDAAARRSA